MTFGGVSPTISSTESGERANVGVAAKAMYQVRRHEDLWPCGDVTREAFVARVQEEGALHYRELPWRHIDDAYAVLVSEVMLQQTQVSRVERYWERFLEAFPTLADLAAGSVAELLSLWQGLGYNRRALSLKKAAERVVAEHKGVLPDSFDALVKLPGIGPATAAGVLAFAYEKPAVYVETNVRAVFIHELFGDEMTVADADLVPYVADTADVGDPRSWYYGILDYGAALKKSGTNPTRKSTSYARQSPFEGSRRQKRAELVRIVLNGGGETTRTQARALLDDFERAHNREAVADELFDSLVEELCREGFVSEQDGLLCVPEQT